MSFSTYKDTTLFVEVKYICIFFSLYHTLFHLKCRLLSKTIMFFCFNNELNK